MQDTVIALARCDLVHIKNIVVINVPMTNEKSVLQNLCVRSGYADRNQFVQFDFLVVRNEFFSRNDAGQLLVFVKQI